MLHLPGTLEKTLRKWDQNEAIFLAPKGEIGLYENNFRYHNLTTRPPLTSLTSKYLTPPRLWQYKLWSFQAGVTKLERFLH